MHTEKTRLPEDSEREALERRIAELEARLAERRQSDEALRASEFKHRIVADHTYDWEFWLDPDGRFLYTSPSCERITGRTAAEFMADAELLRRIVHPDDAADFEAHRRDVVERRRPHEAEWRIVRPDGTVRWIAHTCVPVLDPEGRFWGTRGSNRDITEHKRAEDRHHTALRTAIDGFCITDESGRIVEVNDAYCRMSGYTRSELLNMRIADLEAVENPEEIAEHIRKLLATGADRFETRHRRKDGSLIDLAVSVSCTQELKGLFVSFLRDISGRRKVEAERQRDRELLEAIRQAQSLYVAEADAPAAFKTLLETLVRITGSEFGFLDEVCREADGSLYKLNLAISDIAWDDVSRDLYAQLKARQLRFTNLDNLAGLPARTGEVLIANDAPNHPRAGGLPAGHPPIRSYMGLPLFHGGEVVGVAGVANRPGGYAREDARFLEPLLNACAGVIVAFRRAEREAAQERALAESEARYRRFVETSQEGIWAMDARHCTTFVNRRMTEMLGYAESEMLGAPVTDFMFEEDLDDHRAKMGVREAGQGAVYERRFRRKDGSECWTQVSATALTGADGSFAGSFAFCSDITERKRAEREREALLKEIQAREREKAALLAGASTILEGRPFVETARAIFDRCRELVGAQSGYVALLSENGEENEVLFLEAGGRSCTVDPNLPMPIRGLRAEAYRTGRAVYENDFSNSEWSRFMPPGHVRLDNALFAPLNLQGKTVGLIGLANKPGGFTDKDATEAAAFGNLAAIALRNSRDRESLRSSEERLRLAMEATSDGLWDWDLVSGHVYWNPRAYTMLGYAPDEFPVTFEVWKSLLHPDDREPTARSVEEQIRAGGTFVAEFRYRMKHGGWKWIMGRGRTVAWDAQGQPTRMVGTHVDIDGRKQMEEALRASEERHRSLVDSAADHIFMLDAEGRYLSSNRATVRDRLARGETCRLRDLHSEAVSGLYLERVRQVFAHAETVTFEHEAEEAARKADEEAKKNQPPAPTPKAKDETKPPSNPLGGGQNK